MTKLRRKPIRLRTAMAAITASQPANARPADLQDRFALPTPLDGDVNETKIK
jgi:hypothetical protein